MRIEKHKLVEAPVGIILEYREDPDVAKAPLFEETPKLAVIHYAVTESARATAAVLDSREYVSCHVTLDRDGRVIQQVPFNRVAWHAGESRYKGIPKVSRFSLGIEISNPGPLELKGGQYFTTYGRLWTGEVVEAFHKNDTARRGWRFWAGYTQTEIDLTIHLCELWRQQYGITDIVGHDDIAPGRKSDPGPAFPMQAVRDAVFPGRARADDPNGDVDPDGELLSPDDVPTRPDRPRQS